VGTPRSHRPTAWSGCPTAHEDVRHTLAINLEPQTAKAPKAPLPYTVIESALSTYGETLPELRAKALVLIAWSTMLRRSELVARRAAEWRPAADRDDGTLLVERTKGKKKRCSSAMRRVPPAGVLDLQERGAAFGERMGRADAGVQRRVGAGAHGVPTEAGERVPPVRQP
jgi:hypothetical protein